MVIKDLRTTLLRVGSYNGLLKIVVRTPDPGLGGYPPPLYPKCSEESAQSSKEKHTYMLLPGRGALISCIYVCIYGTRLTVDVVYISVVHRRAARVHVRLFCIEINVPFILY